MSTVIFTYENNIIAANTTASVSSIKTTMQKAIWIITHFADIDELLLLHDLRKLIPELTLSDLRLIKLIISDTNDKLKQLEKICRILDKRHSFNIIPTTFLALS